MAEIEELTNEAFTDLVESIYAFRDTDTDQGLADLMAACMYVHDSLLAVAEKRGLSEIVGYTRDPNLGGMIFINHPSLPNDIDYPETIETRGAQRPT